MSSTAVSRLAGTALPERGQLVRVRARSYLVEEVVPAAHPGEQTLVRLSCLDDDAHGEELAVLWEHAIDSALTKSVRDLPRREVIQVDVDGLPPDAPELRLAELLDRYATLRAERLASRKTAQAAAQLITSHLQRRLFSSIEAFARTLQVHRASLERAEKTAGASLPATGTAVVSPAERAVLDEMAAVADGVRYLPDPRVRLLVEWIRENLLDFTSGAPRWNRRRVLVFTEFTDTARYLVTRFRSAIASVDRESGGPDSRSDFGVEGRVAVFHGGLGDETCEDLEAAFNSDPDVHPLRILIATDSAREGVNLQNHCADLFHFDVPWSPGRIEQRNGRIDRQLQREKVVRCHYFFFAQRPEDKVLRTLVQKTETIQKELGSLSTGLEKRLLDRFFSQGFDRDDLFRACCAQTKDPAPSVVLLGRLTAFGDGAARLHDEVIALAARWVEPDARKGPLRPYAETAEERALALLEESLLASDGTSVPESTRTRLLATSAFDLEDLLPALRERGEESLRCLRDRLADLEKELTTEPDRIRRSFEVRATRLEPVGLAYLWPVSG